MKEAEELFKKCVNEMSAGGEGTEGAEGGEEDMNNDPFLKACNNMFKEFANISE